MDRSRIAMLIGLTALALVVASRIDIELFGISDLRGVLPWIFLAFAWSFLSGKGGSCCSRGAKRATETD